MTHHSHQALAMLAICGALSACGGGGGGDGQPDAQPQSSAITLTDANKQQVAQSAVGAANSASQIGNTGSGLVGGVAVDTPAAGSVQWPLMLANKGLGLMAGTHPGAGMVGGVAATETLTCSGGGKMEVTSNDADNSRSVSKGDSMNARFTNCSETVSGVAMLLNGAFSMNVNDAVGDPSTSSTYTVNLVMSMPAPGLGMKMTVGGKTLETTASGDLNMLLKQNLTSADITATSNNFKASSASGESFSYRNFNMKLGAIGSTSTVSVDGDIAVSSPQLNGSYTLNMSSPATPLVVTGLKRYPDSGEVRITGANGTLTVTAQPNGMALLKLDADGKSVSTTTTWCTIGNC